MALLHRNSLTRPVAEKTDESRWHSTPYPSSRNPIISDKKIHKHGPHFPPKLVKIHGVRLCGSPSVRGATTRRAYHGIHSGYQENSHRIPPSITPTLLLPRIVANQRRQPPAIIALLPLDDFRFFVWPHPMRKGGSSFNDSTPTAPLHPITRLRLLTAQYY